MAELRKYNAATTILFPLIDRDGVDFEQSPVTFATGDTEISKDEGNPANTASNPVHRGNGIYSLALTNTELSAGRIVITIIDLTATKLWEDQAVLIETYGNASAQHAFDLDLAAQLVALSAQGKLDVNAEADTALSDYDPPTKAEMDTGHGLLATEAKQDIIDTVADAIKAVTDLLPDAGALSDLAAILTDTGTTLPAAHAALPTAIENADALLQRAISNVEPSAAARTLYGAIAALVNRRRFNGSGDLEVFKTDDAAILMTLTRTTDASGTPTKELDPT